MRLITEKDKNEIGKRLSAIYYIAVHGFGKGKKKAEAEEEEQGEKVPAGFYKKLAFFFTADQVKAIG